MLYSEVEDHLEHFGVKGMKWGVRREISVNTSKAAYATAKRDRKASVKLSKTSYKGVQADRKALREDIQSKIKNDPEYAAALKKLDRNQRIKSNAIIATAVVGYIGYNAGMAILASQGSNIYNAAVSANANYASRNKFNPKSRYWDGVTVSGSVVNTSMELVKRYTS